jgi:glycosyltransferase involved in cell wall biosynthesis
MKEEYIAVIPTYNNADTVSGIISDVRQYVDTVLVVNDGSTDSTQKILDNIPGIITIGYAENKGKGYAIKTALKKAEELGFRYAITIDSDGQHMPGDIPVFMERIEQVPDSLLIGERNLKADNMPARNTFANKFSNLWYRIETGQRLSDTQSGFRLYPLHRLNGMKFISRRYEFEVEVIVRAAWHGIHVENIPIRVYYPPEDKRISHFRPFKDFLRISLLNTLLVLFALLVYHPWKFVKSLKRQNIKAFFDRQIIHSAESNLQMATSIGWGIFCGIIPVWGYQMIFAGISAHFLRLNKIVAVVFSNISIPPMIPVILYASMCVGAWITGTDNPFTLNSISLETVSMALGQYLAGSVILATMAGTAAFFIAWLTMTICRRKIRRQ